MPTTTTDRQRLTVSLPAILQKLTGGDRRSIGKSNEVVTEVLTNPRLFGALFSGLQSDDPVLRARAADAVEKITRLRPEFLLPRRATLIGPLAYLDQKEVRWHLAQLLPRVRWNKAERQRVLRVLMEYLNDPSRIVKTFAMQALTDLTHQAPRLRPRVLVLVRELTRTGTPAMQARGRRLLKELAVPGHRTNRN